MIENIYSATVFGSKLNDVIQGKNSSLDFPPNEVMEKTFPGERFIPKENKVVAPFCDICCVVFQRSFAQNFPLYFNTIGGQPMTVWTHLDEPIYVLRQKIYDQLVHALHVQEHEDDVDARYDLMCTPHLFKM